MIMVYENEINKDSIIQNLNHIQNQIYRLLPVREEKGDWIKPLETLIIEIAGMSYIFSSIKEFLSLLAKLQGILVLQEDVDFYLYRRTIFECCGLVDKIKDKIN